jgi:succinate dehydrogenase / fumarate reductase iron-sulfur subunit
MTTTPTPNPLTTGAATPKTIHVRIKRQDGPTGEARYEDFRIPYRKNMNVIGVLMEIQRNPVDANNQKVAPPIWEASCLEKVCGSCSMVINGKAQQACAALVDHFEQPLVLEPMSTFPIVRDLVVDRSRIFEAFKKVKGWVQVDGTHDLGPGPRQSPADAEWQYDLSRCMACAVCLEVCPNVNEHSPFIGAAPIAMAARMNTHPTGKMDAPARLDALMEKGGVMDCGNDQNCVQACPKGIPLTTAIAKMKKDVTIHAIKKWIRS